jgi:ESS family glutamate:Na+ symporter
MTTASRKELRYFWGSLIGGHGTTIAWARLIEDRFGVSNAIEIGVAAATLGLVIASLVGGPVAGLLVSRHGLSGLVDETPVVGLPDDVPDQPNFADLNHVSLLRTFLVLNVTILIGFTVDELVAETGLKLPLFLVCLLVAIVLTNTAARLPQLQWPTRTRSLALVSDLSLNIFLAMSLMSMQLQQPLSSCRWCPSSSSTLQMPWSSASSSGDSVTYYWLNRLYRFARSGVEMVL